MQKQCGYCGRFFVPDPRQAGKQKTCGQKKCRRKHKKQNNKAWREANPGYDIGRYEETKNSPSRSPEARKQYRSLDHVKLSNAENMARYRARRKIEDGGSVRCTRFDIEVKPHCLRTLPTDRKGFLVRCTSTDITISFAALEAISNKSFPWDVRCTSIDRCPQ